MFAKTLTSSVIGLDSVLIEVEVDLPQRGLPSFSIVGLAEKSVEEARERCKSAIRNSGCEFPNEKIIVNLAPSDLPKEGTSFDLPIAIGILKAFNSLRDEDYSEKLFIGELSLTGELKSVSGVLPMLFLVKKEKISEIYVPKENSMEANIICSLYNKTHGDRQIKIYPVDNLKQLILHLNKTEEITPLKDISIEQIQEKQTFEVDFSDVKGQEFAKRALEIAAAGSHNVAMEGPPGAGKTMMARCLVSILPRLTIREALEVSKIYSICGLLSKEKPIIMTRQFRSPHHTISNIGLIGGGSHPRPGEISLAHRGVLFLDEFPQFTRSAIESLRAPLEDGAVVVSRATMSIEFPARFVLVASSNPCPCGFYGDSDKRCVCTPTQILNYKKKISGPILDRIDIHLEVPKVKYEKLTNQNLTSEKSSDIRTRVQKARDIQTQRFKGTNIFSNAEMKTAEIKKFCKLDQEGENLIKQAVIKMSLSARSYFRILKVSRTIADLDNKENIEVKHIAEALQMRKRE